MLKLILVCYVTGLGWKPPTGWVVTEVENRAHSAAVTIVREEPDPKGSLRLVVPAGCVTAEPQNSYLAPAWVIPTPSNP
jgi:hypothetical protein